MKEVASIIAFNLLLAFGLLMCPKPILADTISDSLTVYSPIGAVVASVFAKEVGEDPTHVYLIKEQWLVDPDQFGNPTVLLDSNGRGSDIFGIYETEDDKLYLAFSSDSDTAGVRFGDAERTFREGNGSFDATLYLAPDLREDGYTARFTSDADTVPEPSTLVMLSVGLLFIIGIAARKRHETNLT